MIKVLIADDHPLMREGVRRILEQASDLEIVAEASSGRETLQIAADTRPDVVLLDVTMPDGGGVEVLAEMPDGVRVLVLSMHEEEDWASRMLKAGASGYLNKKAAPNELVDAIHRVHQGQRYVSADFASRLAAGLADGTADQPHERLSAREFQVFQKLGSGRTLTQTAGDLSISVKTVSTHRARILEKMGLSSTAEMIHYAISHNLSFPIESTA